MTLLKTKEVADHAGHSLLQPLLSQELSLQELLTGNLLNNNALIATKNLKDAMEDG